LAMVRNTADFASTASVASFNSGRTLQ
jgi:hypothetical protein